MFGHLKKLYDVEYNNKADYRKHPKVWIIGKHHYNGKRILQADDAPVVGCWSGALNIACAKRNSNAMMVGIDYWGTAFETIYFWPGLEKCFTQVARVLKSGGLFMIVNESDGTDKTSLKFEKIIDGMKCYTVDEIKDALKSSGFSKIKAYHHKTKPWITVIAKK